MALVLKLSKNKLVGTMGWLRQRSKLHALVVIQELVVAFNVRQEDIMDLGLFLVLMLVLLIVLVIILLMDGRALVALAQLQLLPFAAQLVLLALMGITMVLILLTRPQRLAVLPLLLLLLPLRCNISRHRIIV